MLTRVGELLLTSPYVPYKNTGVQISGLSNTSYKYIGAFGYDSYQVINSIALLTSSLNSNGIVLGSGTTAPARDDADLADRITSGISGTVVVSDEIDGNGNVSLDFTISVQNTSSAPITISEVGFVHYMSCASGANYANFSYALALVSRDLLDAPITIPPNEAATIDYVFKTPCPVE